MTYLSNPEHSTFLGFTHEELSAHFNYNPDTGEISDKQGNVFTRRENFPLAYLVVPIKLPGRASRAAYGHRLAWFLYHGSISPTLCIDHIDTYGPKTDNRICNLRQVSRAENLRNKRMMKNNTTGEGNISWSENSQRYSVRFAVDGNQYFVNKFFYVNHKRSKDEAFEQAIAYRDYSKEVLVAAGLFSPQHGRPNA